MKRINRIIELLEEGQPVYWAGGVGLSYEGGVKSAQTTADWLVIGIEHGPYDITALREFMRGLVDGGSNAYRSSHAAGDSHLAL